MSPALARANRSTATMSYRLRKKERGYDSKQMLQYAQAEIIEARGAHLYERRHVACPRRLHAQDKLHGCRGVARLPLCSLPLILVLELARTEHVALENVHFHCLCQQSQALLRFLAPDTNLVLPCQARPIDLLDILAVRPPLTFAFLECRKPPVTWSSIGAATHPCSRTRVCPMSLIHAYLRHELLASWQLQ